MNRKLLLTAVLVIAVNPLAMAAPSPELRKEGKPAGEERTGKVKPYPLRTCIVSGDALEAMGGAAAFTHRGQEIKICCRPCKKDFDKDPAKYLKKLKGK